jgi:hypothetical protein
MGVTAGPGAPFGQPARAASQGSSPGDDDSTRASDVFAASSIHSPKPVSVDVMNHVSGVSSMR